MDNNIKIVGPNLIASILLSLVLSVFKLIIPDTPWWFILSPIYAPYIFIAIITIILIIKKKIK